MASHPHRGVVGLARERTVLKEITPDDFDAVGPEYGLGLIRWADRPLGNAVGHVGHVPGYRALMVRYVESDVAIALLFNCNTDQILSLVYFLEEPIVDHR